MRTARSPMNSHRMPPAWASWLLALFAAAVSAHAITLYPTGDTYSTLDYSGGKNPAVTKRFITSAAGATGSLYVSKTHSAFVQFGAAAQLAGATVTGARLTIYFPSAAKAGDLDVSIVTSAWTEKFKASAAPEPAYTASFGQIPAASVVAKQFAVVDVTPEVQAWVSGATADHGFAISADQSSPAAIANILLGAKEGPGSGYPATLEVDVIDPNAPTTGTSATFSGTVGIGTSTPGALLDVQLQASVAEIGTLIAQFGDPISPRIQFFDESLDTNLGPTINFDAGNVGQISGNGNIALMPSNNVGINTLSPGSTLEVNGSAQVDGPLSANSFSGDGSALTNLAGANIAAGTVGNAALGLCKISGFVGSCGNGDPTHTFVYVRGTSSLAYVGDSGASGYPYQITLMEPGTYTLVARAANGTETSTQVTVAAGQTKAGVNFGSPTNMTDPNNCGNCAVTCPSEQNSSPACAAGNCTIACKPGFANCDGQINNGCEVNTMTDRNNCSACGNVCPVGKNCVGGTCQ